MDIKIQIGQRIKQLREKIQLSQKDLSFAADLDRSYIASIESGQRNVSIVNIEKISCALGVTLKEFFDDGKFDNSTPSSP
jgi:transcriptional regulator with XRE-family HTH domain